MNKLPKTTKTALKQFFQSQVFNGILIQFLQLRCQKKKNPEWDF